MDRLRLKLIAEDLPQARNRVVLENDEPVIEWHGHHDYGFRGLERARAALPDILPFDIEGIIEKGFDITEAHIQGTHRMGRDPTDSVVDPYLRCHEAPNIWALGAGSFPSCSPANPTLTLSALSLRAGAAV